MTTESSAVVTADDIATACDEVSGQRGIRKVDEIARVIEDEGYTDLTNDEIDLYIAWRERVAVSNAQAVAQLSEIQTRHDQLAEQTRAAYETAQAAFEAACAQCPITFESVIDDG